MSDARLGVVSVVLVNYRGTEDTIACLDAFRRVEWPAERLELVVVDNNSGDGSAARINEAVPHAVVIESPTNSGFAGGCNTGVAAATGEYVGFINNDARPHPQWISSAVDCFRRDSSIGCVASKVLDWDGAHIDYVDGSMTWYGMGYKREVGRADSPEFDVPRDVLFATGAAMFVRTNLFREVGGFDERFFMFYEDVDFGWRLNLLGHRVRFEPSSVAYHRHHATMNKFGDFREAYLLERNSLLSMYKNYDNDSLARTFPAAMALSIRRSVARTDTDASILDLQHSPGGDTVQSVEVSKMSLSGPYAIDYFVSQLPTLVEDRRKIQAARVRSDRDLVPLFRQAMEPAYAQESYLEGYRWLIDAFGIEEHFSSRRRIVVVTGEPLLPAMAGPAIRAWEIAKALSIEHDIQLVSLAESRVSHPRFRCRRVTGTDLRQLEQWCDIIIFQGFLLEAFPWLKESQKVIIADVYDPIHLEVLEQSKDQVEEDRALSVQSCTHALNEQLRRGDFFLCASDKQRDFWLGQLAGVGRINPLTYDQDETMASLIATVPFGVSDDPPKHSAPAIKGVIPGIGHDDKVILWGGGIYNWFDPLTLLRAVDRLRSRRPDVRLFFMGLKHPNPHVPEMRMAYEARALSDDLGLTDKFVFFNEGWVSYEERQNYLLESDLGVSTHLEHIETAYSFRTRILDYLWTGLPVVATGGDTFAQLIEEHGLGSTVPPRDVEALEEALDTHLYDDDRVDVCRRNVAAFAPSLAWSKVLEPLAMFCRSPQRAPDLVERLGEVRSKPRPFIVRQRTNLRGDAALLRQYLAAGGAGEVARRAFGRIRRVTREGFAGARG